LSGGEVKVNKKTWYAHLFRTQGGDFGFPYPNPGNEQKKAKDTLRDTFLNDKWDKAKHKLSWLIEKFNPPEWGKTKGIIFYTDNQLKLNIAHKVQNQLNKIGLPITSASLKPMSHFGDNEVINLPRGKEAYFNQIISCLERSKAEIVYFCEHDVLYHPSHFEFTPKDDKFYFNTNVYKWRYPEAHFVKVNDCKQVSGLVCFRKIALECYKEKLKQLMEDNFDRHFEPQNDRVSFQSEFPIVDIRHGNNFTASRWSIEEFRNKFNTEGWTEVNDVEGWNLVSN